MPRQVAHAVTTFQLFVLVFANACGSSSNSSASNDQAKDNHCAMKLRADEDSGLQDQDFEIDSAVPPAGTGRPPLIAASHRAVDDGSNVTCQYLAADDELQIIFSVWIPEILDEAVPFQFDERDDSFEAINVQVKNGDQEWQCGARIAKHSTLPAAEAFGTFSFEVDSARGFEIPDEVVWYEVHGQGHAVCPAANEETSGNVTVSIAF